MNGRPIEDPQSARGIDPLSDSLRWTLALGADPSRSTIDWIAIELDPECENAAQAICRNDPDPGVDLDRLELLKSGFKSLRIGAETSGDRSLAARYYAATIAAGVARHRTWITTQRPQRAEKAIRDLEGDHSIPDSLRTLATRAVEVIDGEIIQTRDPG